jgi:hypothetical protein
MASILNSKLSSNLQENPTKGRTIKMRGLTLRSMILIIGSYYLLKALDLIIAHIFIVVGVNRLVAINFLALINIWGVTFAFCCHMMCKHPERYTLSFVLTLFWLVFVIFITRYLGKPQLFVELHFVTAVIYIFGTYMKEWTSSLKKRGGRLLLLRGRFLKMLQ